MTFLEALNRCANSRCELCAKPAVRGSFDFGAPEDLRGASICLDCFYIADMPDRIRARRAAQSAEPKRDAPLQLFELDPNTCISCSKPGRPVIATHGEMCVYCHKSSLGADAIAHLTGNNSTDAPARVRMAIADRKAAPRATAESRELSKAHPWSNCDD